MLCIVPISCVRNWVWNTLTYAIKDQHTDIEMILRHCFTCVHEEESTVLTQWVQRKRASYWWELCKDKGWNVGKEWTDTGEVCKPSLNTVGKLSMQIPLCFKESFLLSYQAKVLLCKTACSWLVSHLLKFGLEAILTLYSFILRYH